MISYSFLFDPDTLTSSSSYCLHKIQQNTNSLRHTIAPLRRQTVSKEQGTNDTYPGGSYLSTKFPTICLYRRPPKCIAQIFPRYLAKHSTSGDISSLRPNLSAFYCRELDYRPSNLLILHSSEYVLELSSTVSALSIALRSTICR